MDAVIVSHGHPDHCADLNPLLRARTLRDVPCPPLPVYALPGALGPASGLDRLGMLDRAILRHEFDAGSQLTVGPFRISTLSLPHFVPNVGVRVNAGGEVLAYTGDSGPSPNLVPLAEGADLFLAEATYTDEVPEDSAHSLSSALQAGEVARRAHARRLLLAHVWPGTDRDELEHAARGGFAGPVASVVPGMTVDLARKTEGHQSF